MGTICAYCIRQHQFCLGRAVKTAVILLQDIHQIRIGGSLYRKELAESGIPCESFLYRLGILSDSCLIIQIKGRGVGFGDLLYLFLGHIGDFIHNTLHSAGISCRGSRGSSCL